METIESEVSKMLNKECLEVTHVSVYMKHLIVQVVSPCSSATVKSIKAEISRLVIAHFPSRHENLPFLIRGFDLPDETFTLYKSNYITVKPN